MTKKPDDPRRVQVWEAMADHFLDTETRHLIPLTALRCVEAGLSAAEARDVWRYEVSPAVFLNLLSVAGEWAGWDRDWLVETIRSGPARPTGVRKWLCDKLDVSLIWVSLERCIDELHALQSPKERELLCRDLTFLAQHYFDLFAKELSDLDPAARARVRLLYPDTFRCMMAPALLPGEARDADRRVRGVFERDAVR